MTLDNNKTKTTATDYFESEIKLELWKAKCFERLDVFKYKTLWKITVLCPTVSWWSTIFMLFLRQMMESLNNCS